MDEQSVNTNEQSFGGNEPTFTENVIDTPTIEPQQIKRKRGRPRKDGSTQTAQAFNVQSQEIKKETKTQKEKKELDEKVNSLITMFESVTTIALQTDTKFNESELNLIRPSITNAVENFNPKTAETMNKWIAPIFLVIGTVLWGVRVLPNSKTIQGVNNVKDTSNDTTEQNKNPSDSATIFSFITNP